MDILKEIQEIRMMPHNELRDKKIYHLYKYLYYLYDSGQIDETKFEVTKKIIGCKPLELNVPPIDQYESLYQLTCLYDEILNNAKEYNIQQFDSFKIDLDEYMAYAIEFFKFMNVYDLYRDIKDNNLLSFINSKTNYTYRGKTYELGDGKSCIVVENNSDLFTLITLVHEMGHAYAFYLRKDYPKRKPYGFETECLSITFEYLFLEFLRKNKLIKPRILKTTNIGRLSDLLIAMDFAHTYNNYIFDNNLKVKREINIPQQNMEKLCMIKHNNLLRLPHEHYTLKFRSNYYAYGFLFAMVMKERFRQDENETRKYLESLPSLAYNYLSSELIKSIPSAEYISTTNKFISKTLTKTK